MEKIIALGRPLFGLAVAALGIENLICARSGEVVLPVLPWLPPHPVLGYLVGIALLAAGLATTFNIKTRLAATLLGIFLLVCAFVLQLPRAAARPFDLSLRTVLFEVLALCGAALTLGGTLPEKNNFQQRAGIFDNFLKSGRYLFAVSSVVFGVSHFLVPRFIASLIPAWIPGALFWAYFTGASFVAAGLSTAIRVLDRLAAILLGTMFLLWFLLVHAPRVLSTARSHNPNEWSSAFIALGICGAS
jgi:uncharacterized membrane protein YphA (DoxX/SURF4 family)